MLKLSVISAGAATTPMDTAVRGDEVHPPLIANPYLLDPAQASEYENGYQYAQKIGHQQLLSVPPEQLLGSTNGSVPWRQGFAASARAMGAGQVADTIEATIKTAGVSIVLQMTKLAAGLSSGIGRFIGAFPGGGLVGSTVAPIAGGIGESRGRTGVFDAVEEAGIPVDRLQREMPSQGGIGRGLGHGLAASGAAVAGALAGAIPAAVLGGDTSTVVGSGLAGGTVGLIAAPAVMGYNSGRRDAMSTLRPDQRVVFQPKVP